MKIKESAKNTIGCSDNFLEFNLENMINLYINLNNKIEDIIKELDPPTLSIKGIGPISCAGIISEFGDITRFKSANACVAFAGIEPSIFESGIDSHTGKMVKHGSGLKHHLLNTDEIIFIHEPIFADFYYKNVMKTKLIELLYLMLRKKLLELFIN